MASGLKAGEVRPDDRPGGYVGIWLGGDLCGAFERYLSTQRPRVSRTSAVEVALEEFLAKRGFWPDKGQGVG